MVAAFLYLFIHSCSSACWEFYTILEPRMCCDMKPLIVTMVEMHMLIVDVCVRLCQPGENVLMHYMNICSSEDLFT